MTTRVPREVLTYGPGAHLFYPGDHRWARTVRFHVQPGQGGSASDGTPGERVPLVSVEYPVDTLDPVLEIVVGRGGRGAPGAADGDDGFILVELYGDTPTPEGTA